MADNITLNAGSGGSVAAADDISSVFFPRGKLTLGADGVNDGDVSKTNPLPVGGNTAADGSGTETRLLTDAAGNLQIDVLTLPNVAGTVTANAGTGTFTVDGSGVTQPISAASLPLPTGAATAAKQPALGTAGTASADVLTVQGVASMTPILVNGSGVTQPISAAALPLPTGAATSANQTTGNTALSAIQTSVELIDNAISGSEMQVDIVGALPAGTNAIGKLAANSGVTIGAVEIASAQTIGLAAGTNGIGKLTANSGVTIGAVETPAATTGGATPLSVLSAASTNATSVKASAGTLYTLMAFNSNAAARYLKFYNKASAPTVGTDTPVLRFMIPGNTAGSGFACPIPACGIAFGTGIALALTTGAADSDSNAVAANEIIVAGAYK